jgi:hypothetical protein
MLPAREGEAALLFVADRRRHARARRLDPAAVTFGAGKR